MIEIRSLELLNATLGLSLLLIAIILIRDFRKQMNKENKLRIPITLMGAGIIVFSIREFLKYALAEGGDTVLDELLETVYLLLNLGAFFSLLMIKELPSWKVKKD